MSEISWDEFVTAGLALIGYSSYYFYYVNSIFGYFLSKSFFVS
jgi:hypothetical protein